MSDFAIPPAPSELEVSVIGPGYGEAIVVHVGQNHWFLVDSCKAPNSRQPASLEYLEALGVDYTRAVKQVIITHWHQDHVNGIDEIVGACPEAQVVVSEALRTEEFLGLVDLHSQSPTGSGVEALSRVILLLAGRKSRDVRYNSPEWAVAYKTLSRENISLDGHRVLIRLEALSPASATLMQAKQALIQHIVNPVKSRKRVSFDKPNAASVVLWLQVGPHQILLGADMEDSPHRNDGWKAIVNGSSRFMDNPADLFKIPHHGSENGHNDEVWDQLLIPGPCAVITPWYLSGRYLPIARDLKRIVELTPHAYLTCPTGPRKSRFTDNTVRRTVREATASTFRLDGRWGHVRLRRPILDSSATWSVDLLGSAHLLLVDDKQT